MKKKTFKIGVYLHFSICMIMYKIMIFVCNESTYFADTADCIIALIIAFSRGEGLLQNGLFLRYST